MRDDLIGNPAVMIFPLTDGRAFVEGRGIMSLEAALADGHTLANGHILGQERNAEIEGWGADNRAWAHAAAAGVTLNYDFDASGYLAQHKEAKRQTAAALAASKPKTDRQRELMEKRDAAAANKLNVDPNNAPADAAAQSEWAAAIVESEEAQLRPDAAATLLEIHSEETISVSLAVAMLGSLPIEHYHTTTNPEDQMSNHNATAALVRASELRASALAVRGDAKSLTESKRINAALHQHRSMGAEIVPALRDAGVDIAPIAAAAKSAA